MTDIFSKDQIEQLTTPLDKKHVSQRKQAGTQLSYIEAWHAIAEANRIFGHGSWDRRLVRLEEVDRGTFTSKSGKEMARVEYIATVEVRVYGAEGTITRQGTGFGSGMGLTNGEAHEGAVKEAESDAMKRALMTFGWPFGLALYDKKQENVASSAEIDKRNNEADAVMKAGELLTELDKGVTDKRKEEIKTAARSIWKYINEDAQQKFKEHFS